MDITLIKEYLDQISNNTEKYYDDYLKVKQKMQKSTAKYYGQVIDFLYQPMFFDAEDIQKFRYIGQTLMNIIDKVINEYINNEQFRAYFGFPELMEQLILIDPGYSTNVPMARFDIFYDSNGRFKFCELNGDGTSAMNETNTLERIFMESDIAKYLQKRYKLYYHELFYSWIDKIIGIYKEYGGRSKPNVAIVDWEGVGTIDEFYEFKKRFEHKGYNTVIADPRALEYRRGKLYYMDFDIDLVYRRALTWELIERADKVQDFLNAYKDGAVCVVGPIRSQVMHNKKIFAILCDKTKTPFLSDQERQFIDQHIPHTQVFCRDRQQVDYLIENRQNLVLKPQDKYAAKGVYIGRDYDADSWKDIIDNIIQKDLQYLIQEFVQPPKVELATYDDNGNLKVQRYNYILGLYMYDRQFSGLYTRVGKNNIIASVSDCKVVPSIVVQN